MSFNVYVRSAHAESLPGTVRPSGANLYFQIDNWHDLGPLLHQSEQSITNIQFPIDIAFLSSVRVVNTFKTINDVVTTTSNNERKSDLPCLEDGRSRRYLLGLGNFYQIISVPTTECHLPIAFASFSSDVNLTTGAVFQMRFFRAGNSFVELLVAFIGGKNLHDDSKVSIADYRNDVTIFMNTLSSIKAELERWKREASIRTREFVMLYYKDHASPAESFDYIAFHNYYAQKFNLIQRTERSFMRGRGWQDIVGSLSSSKSFSISTALHGYDDHQPALFKVSTYYSAVTPELDYSFSREYRINKDNAISVAYRSHNREGRISESTYRLIRAKYPIEYP